MYDSVRVLRSDMAGIIEKSTPWTVELGGNTLWSSRGPMLFPKYALALGVAAEWERQGKMLKSTSMPLTSLCTVAFEGFLYENDTKPKLDKLSEYFWTDSACYRSPEEAALKDKQDRILSPVLRWLEDKYNVEEIFTTSETIRLAHSEETAKTLLSQMERMDCWELSIMDSLVKLSKSYLLGLAFVDGHLSAESFYIAARLEEDHQILRWGEVQGGHDIDIAHAKTRIHGASSLLALLRSDIVPVEELEHVRGEVNVVNSG